MRLYNCNLFPRGEELWSAPLSGGSGLVRKGRQVLDYCSKSLSQWGSGVCHSWVCKLVNFSNCRLFTYEITGQFRMGWFSWNFLIKNWVQCLALSRVSEYGSLVSAFCILGHFQWLGLCADCLRCRQIRSTRALGPWISETRSTLQLTSGRPSSFSPSSHSHRLRQILLSLLPLLPKTRKSIAQDQA